MMVARLVATRFDRFMGSGRTRPGVCGCEYRNGRTAGDFVTKFCGSETGTSGLVLELVGSLLAAQLGILTPDPAIVELPADLSELIALEHADAARMIRASVGLNFGSRLLTENPEWPIDKKLPDVMRQSAAEVFAFDALIQNVDRRYDNQNLFARGNQIYVFDHETAFSFLQSILPTSDPWTLEDQPYLTDHVFYRPLKGGTIELRRFIGALKGLTNSRLAEIESSVPAKWRNDSLAKIFSHVSRVRDHAEDFTSELRRMLA